ncbi:hypothetical protein BDV12DRAFT_200745 [Aspergillus spectabilis]
MYTHAHPYTPLLDLLSSHLPYSGPLLQDSVPNGDSDSASPWLASYTDINRGPDTQVWVFSSLETSLPSPNSGAEAPLSTPQDEQGNALGHFNTAATTQEKELVKFQLLDLFKYIRSTLIPPYLSHLSTQLAVPVTVKEEGVPKIPIHPSTSILLGTIHIGLVALIAELQAESTSRLKIHRGNGVFYVKYCFPSEVFEIPTAELERSAEDKGDGNGYRFHDSNGVYGIQERHINLVKSRTNIPRSTKALLAMGGVALYQDKQLTGSEEKGEEMPIAWAFLGFDGSLCSLHVEPEVRGRGLAAVVGREVMKRGVGRFEPDSDSGDEQALAKEEKKKWFFADVAVENSASRRVMAKMGGLVGWTIAWMVVEVEVE